MKKIKVFLSLVVIFAMLTSFVAFSNAQANVIEVLTTSTVVVTVDTELDLAGYDGVWWTGQRYIWVNLSSNSATDFPALVAPHAENDPAVSGGLGVSIEQDQQLHYFNEDNTPGNVEVTLGTVDQAAKTFTITGGPAGTYSHISANVDPDGWPAAEVEFNIGAAQPISVTVDGNAITLSDNSGVIISWVTELSGVETPATEAPATEAPATEAPGDFSSVALFAIPAIISLGAIAIAKKK